MAATRLDHPIFISAEQIRRREFVTTRRGYDPDQVRAYLEELAEQVELMGSMVREARLEAETAVRAASQPPVDPYERLASRVASVIKEADETAERLRVEGRREAERFMAEARADADRIRTDAQAKAEQARTEAELALGRAREQADRTISGLATRREALVDQLAHMQERLLGVARELEATIEAPMQPDGQDDPDALALEPDPPQVRDAVVDVRTGGDRDESSGEVRRIVADDILDGLDDPAYEELWDGTEAIALDVPDIPPLDLSWDDDDTSGSS